jgi:hypothetical protein
MNNNNHKDIPRSLLNFLVNCVPLSDVCTPLNSFAIVDVMMGFFKHHFSTRFVSLLSLEKFLGS